MNLNEWKDNLSRIATGMTKQEAIDKQICIRL